MYFKISQLIVFCSSSPTGGNQVDGLPPDRSQFFHGYEWTPPDVHDTPQRNYSTR